MRVLRRHFLGLALAACRAVELSLRPRPRTVNAAVAANFTKVATELAATFKAKTGNEVTLSFGATGALYTQITQARAVRRVPVAPTTSAPGRAIKDGFGVDGTDFTYAVGKVVLYSPTLDVTDGAAVLTANAFQHIAIADPKAAPYGAAAMAVLDKLGLTEARHAQDRHRREHHADAAIRRNRQCRDRLSWR